MDINNKFDRVLVESLLDRIMTLEDTITSLENMVESMKNGHDQLQEQNQKLLEDNEFLRREKVEQLETENRELREHNRELASYKGLYFETQILLHEYIINRYDVKETIKVGFEDGRNRLKTIKRVRELTGIGLRQGKDIVEAEFERLAAMESSLPNDDEA